MSYIVGGYFVDGLIEPSFQLQNTLDLLYNISNEVFFVIYDIKYEILSNNQQIKVLLPYEMSGTYQCYNYVFYRIFASEIALSNVQTTRIVRSSFAD